MRARLPQPEVLVGRALAMCAHPYAAWRVRSPAARTFVVLAYTTASYLAMLFALMTF